MRSVFSNETTQKMPPVIASDLLPVLLAGNNLSHSAACDLMHAIIDGSVGVASIAAVAIALRAKGESVEEMAAFASVMRARALHVRGPAGMLDTCGTGGDQSDTFNVSTATALVVAGMGIPVAKHGGRSSSSKTGSADVLKSLGVNIDASAECAERCINEAGIGFMFAPVFHPGMKHVAAVRKELGIRTVFNLLGPLSNPAQAEFQLLGVYEPSLCEKFAKVLKFLGGRSAMVVCGDGPQGKGPLDEISTFGTSHIAWLKDGEIALEQVHPQELGFPLAKEDALFAAGPQESAQIIREILEGRKSPHRDIVVLNAAAAARVAGKAATWEDGLHLATESIDAGRAQAALQKLAKISHS